MENLPAILSPAKEKGRPKWTAFRISVVVWLAFVWLLVPYPYGLVLFLISGYGYGTLKLPGQLRDEIGPANLTPDIDGKQL